MQNEAGDDPAIRRLILAPLRGVTHLSFRRCLMKHFGGLDGAVSPFLTTVAGSKIKATHLADILPESNAFLPLVPQIIGKDPVQFRTLLLAVRDLGYTRCDLNIGCPWPLIVKKGRGAGLLRDPDNLRRMLDAGCDVLGEGLSVKVRLGIDRPGLLLERMEIFNSYPLAEMGFIPAGAYRNEEYASPGLAIRKEIPRALLDIFYDPQTSGGLLIAVPEAHAAALARSLRDRLPAARVIGYVTEKEDKDVVIE